ncbi:hypothetical protein [Vibrio breoganii]|uniref:hypothetical protein n=1 Tax=Vibrio breoganii TaxID=553239 RepID=UPI000C83E3C5|nr:hypothetical protein [Vibrio breoganii]PMG04118.1 hypothetical protein BCV00_15695 [Vibrio breoganii]PMK32908.1 hypothetical protein BCU06_01555 [Vibrio breoganii]
MSVLAQIALQNDARNLTGAAVTDKTIDNLLLTLVDLVDIYKRAKRGCEGGVKALKTKCGILDFKHGTDELEQYGLSKHRSALHFALEYASGRNSRFNSYSTLRSHVFDALCICADYLYYLLANEHNVHLRPSFVVKTKLAKLNCVFSSALVPEFVFARELLTWHK